MIPGWLLTTMNREYRSLFDRSTGYTLFTGTTYPMRHVSKLKTNTWVLSRMAGKVGYSPCKDYGSVSATSIEVSKRSSLTSFMQVGCILAALSLPCQVSVHGS